MDAIISRALVALRVFRAGLNGMVNYPYPSGYASRLDAIEVIIRINTSVSSFGILGAKFSYHVDEKLHC